MNGTHSFIGGRLKKDVFNKYGILLVSKNTILNDENIQKINVNHILLGKADICFENQDVSINEMSRVVIQEATEQVEGIFNLVRYSKKIPILEVREKIIPSIQQAAENPNIFQLFSQLQSRDDYTYRHNIGVGVIATLIGKWMNLSETMLSLLTLSATLHDVGKMKVPLDILNKPGRLTEEEFKHIKKHTIHGYDLIKSTIGLSHRTALVALQHHEREDGSGYPFQLKGEKIDLLSKIVGVADVFHAMTSNRVYHNASPFFHVMKQMNEDVFGKLNPEVVTTFVQHIMKSLVGNDVLLTDGRHGTIIMTHPHDPFRPLVQTHESFVDLTRERTVNIDKVLNSSPI
jgi:HD-GYP domain-containing protein (c-di-GMP phosphodiesterase class II)